MGRSDKKIQKFSEDEKTEYAIENGLTLKNLDPDKMSETVKAHFYSVVKEKKIASKDLHKNARTKMEKDEAKALREEKLKKAKAEIKKNPQTVEVTTTGTKKKVVAKKEKKEAVKQSDGDIKKNDLSSNSYYKQMKKHEGGYKSWAGKHGGETYFGITRKHHKDDPIWTKIDKAKEANGGTLPSGWIDKNLDVDVDKFYGKYLKNAPKEVLTEQARMDAYVQFGVGGYNELDKDSKDKKIKFTQSIGNRLRKNMLAGFYKNDDDDGYDLYASIMKRYGLTVHKDLKETEDKRLLTVNATKPLNDGTMTDIVPVDEVKNDEKLMDDKELLARENKSIETKKGDKSVGTPADTTNDETTVQTSVDSDGKTKEITTVKKGTKGSNDTETEPEELDWHQKRMKTLNEDYDYSKKEGELVEMKIKMALQNGANMAGMSVEDFTAREIKRKDGTKTSVGSIIAQGIIGSVAQLVGPPEGTIDTTLADTSKQITNTLTGNKGRGDDIDRKRSNAIELENLKAKHKREETKLKGEQKITQIGAKATAKSTLDTWKVEQNNISKRAISDDKIESKEAIQVKKNEMKVWDTITKTEAKATQGHLNRQTKIKIESMKGSSKKLADAFKMHALAKKNNPVLTGKNVDNLAKNYFTVGSGYSKYLQWSLQDGNRAFKHLGLESQLKTPNGAVMSNQDMITTVIGKTTEGITKALGATGRTISLAKYPIKAQKLRVALNSQHTVKRQLEEQTGNYYDPEEFYSFFNSMIAKGNVGVFASIMNSFGEVSKDDKMKQALKDTYSGKTMNVETFSKIKFNDPGEPGSAGISPRTKGPKTLLDLFKETHNVMIYEPTDITKSYLEQAEAKAFSTMYESVFSTIKQASVKEAM